MPRRKRRTYRPHEQLELPLVWLAAPVTEVERIQVGHFVGIRYSNARWHLTVAPAPDTYLPQTNTPQQWWAEVAREEFTLHQWSACGSEVIGERDDPELEPQPIDLRAVATRWLRSFNEAFQGWRMEARW